MNNLSAIFPHKTTTTIPIWFMRQAGRYMSEYMNIRNQVANFLELCYDVDKAAAVTMQPIEKFAFDAAIIFSDILILPDILGWDVKFIQGEGPVLKQFTTKEDLIFLQKQKDFGSQVKQVYKAIDKVRRLLPVEKPLIGFAGSPWTVASYLLEGKGKQDFSVSRKFLYQNPGLTKSLVTLLAERTVEHLTNQILAGAQIIQLFDSWAGVLPPEEYDDLVIEPTKLIVNGIKKRFPQVPIIGFPRGSGFLYENYLQNIAIDVIGVDQFVPVKIMRKWQDEYNIIVQGNFDPVLLFSNKEKIRQKADVILSTIDKNKFIFNLGHGILPSTPIDNVEFLVNYVRSCST